MRSTYGDIVLRGEGVDCRNWVGGNSDHLDPRVLELRFLYTYVYRPHDHQSPEDGKRRRRRTGERIPERADFSCAAISACTFSVL
jgi:hypothetical protein